ncbi:hypothetical protein Pfo_013769 [Paulownia fortunei]|nr:hypothetical protein Pfo_013769 [Paulownia fortunei]
MKKYGDVESWSKQFHIDLEVGLGMIVRIRRNVDVLLTARNGGLIAYNQDTEARMELGILGTKDSFYSCSHVESLALLIESEGAREMPLSKNDGECGSPKTMMKIHMVVLRMSEMSDKLNQRDSNLCSIKPD